MDYIAAITTFYLGSMDGIMINKSKVLSVYSTSGAIQLNMMDEDCSNEVYSRIKEYFPNADVQQLADNSVILYTESKSFVMIDSKDSIFISKF